MHNVGDLLVRRRVLLFVINCNVFRGFLVIFYRAHFVWFLFLYIDSDNSSSTRFVFLIFCCCFYTQLSCFVMLHLSICLFYPLN